MEYIKVLSRNLPGRTEESEEDLSHDNRHVSKLELATSRYKSGAMLGAQWRLGP
jgi:hypothetical protein